MPVKSKVKISQNFAAFSEYVNFNKMQKILVPNISMHFYCFEYTRACEVAVAESQTPQPSVPNRNSSRLKHWNRHAWRVQD